MKYPFKIIIIGLFFIFYTTKVNSQEKYKKVINSYLLKNLSNTENYKFISISKIDTVLVKDTYERILKETQKSLKGIKKSDNSLYAKSNRKTLSNDINYYKKKLETVSDTLIDKILVTCKFQATNKSKKLTISEYLIYITPNLQVLDIRELKTFEVKNKESDKS